MPSNDDWFQESDDEFDEADYPDDEADDSTETVACPSCGREVYEEAEQCPYCGSYIIHQTSPWLGRSVWWIVLAVLGLIATIVALSGAGLCPG